MKWYFHTSSYRSSPLGLSLFHRLICSLVKPEIRLLEQVIAGYEPSKEILKKVRRRCVREMDYESDDKVVAFAKQLKIAMGFEGRGDMLFRLQYSRDNA